MTEHVVKRRRGLSIAFGLAAAVIVSNIGPIYAVPLLIVALPVVFLTLSRAVMGAAIEPDFEWLLAAFGVAWLVLLPFAPIVRSSPEAMPIWVAIGVVPALLAAVSAVGRRMARSHDARHRMPP